VSEKDIQKVKFGDTLRVRCFTFHCEGRDYMLQKRNFRL